MHRYLQKKNLYQIKMYKFSGKQQKNTNSSPFFDRNFKKNKGYSTYTNINITNLTYEDNLPQINQNTAYNINIKAPKQFILKKPKDFILDENQSEFLTEKQKFKTNFFSEYKKICQRGPFIMNKKSPTENYLQAVNKNKLLPCVLTDSTEVDQRSLTLSNFGIGSKYASALSRSIKTLPKLSIINLKNNRIGDKSAQEIILGLNIAIVELDLSFNKLGAETITSLITKINSNQLVNLEILNLEKNPIGNRLLEDLMQYLFKLVSLRSLNLSETRLTDAISKQIAIGLESLKRLEHLSLSWNALGDNAHEILESLSTLPELKSLNLAQNKIGQRNKLNLEKLIKIVSPPCKIIHLDMSFNNFSAAEMKIFGDHMNLKNRSLFGLHIEGNSAQIDPRGFIIPYESNNLGYMHLTQRGGFQKLSTNTLLISQGSSCWFCQGWREVEFHYKPDPNSDVKEPVYIHLSFENYIGEWMFKQEDNSWKLVRMCPPGRISFFFTCDKGKIVTENSEDKVVIACNPIVFSLGKDETYVLKPKLMNTMNGEFFDGINNDYSVNYYSILPRTTPHLWAPDAKARQKKKWNPTTAIFASYQKETEEFIAKCFEYDWSLIKCYKFIKNQEELARVKEILKKNYRMLKNAFKYYSALSLAGDIPCISMTLFTEFLNKCGQLDNQSIQVSDIGKDMKAAKFIEKKQKINPDNGLVRFQFLEIIVRISLDKYINNLKLVDIQSAALEKFIEDIRPHCETFEMLNKFRTDQYWCEDIDYLLKGNIQNLNLIWAKYTMRSKLNPAYNKLIVSQAELKQMCYDSGLIETYISDRDPSILYCNAMMTQINELDEDRHLEMTFVEFLEALARIADKINHPDFDGTLLNKIKKVLTLIVNNSLKIPGDINPPIEEYIQQEKVIKLQQQIG